jgi:hypothetical protein
MGIYLSELNQVQVGKETTWGTPVNTTARLMGITSFEIDPITVTTLLNDARGSRIVGTNAVQTDQGATAKFALDGSYEDTLYFVESLFGTVTPTGSGPYTRTYADFLTATPTYRPQTFVFGQAGIPVQLNGGLVDTLTLAGDNGGTLKVSGTLFGKVAQAGTLQSLSDRTVNMIMGANSTMYVDAWGGTMMTTALAASAYSWSLAITAGRAPRKFVGSGLQPGDWNDTVFKAQLTLSAEVNSTTNPWITSLLSFTGPLQLQWAVNYTVGAGATLKQLAIQMPMTVTTSPALFKDRQGVMAFDLKADMTYNPTFGNQLKIISQNGVATIA